MALNRALNTDAREALDLSRAPNAARRLALRYVPFADATRLWQDTGNSEV